MKRQNIMDRAANALDLTHQFDSRGPRTYLCRQRIATSLDQVEKPQIKDIKWLEHVIEIETGNSCAWPRSL